MLYQILNDFINLHSFNRNLKYFCQTNIFFSSFNSVSYIYFQLWLLKCRNIFVAERTETEVCIVMKLFLDKQVNPFDLETFQL